MGQKSFTSVISRAIPRQEVRPMRLTIAEYPAICRVLNMIDYDAGADLCDPDRAVPAEWQPQLPGIEAALRSLPDELLERFVCSKDDAAEHYGRGLRGARQFCSSVPTEKAG